MFHKEGHTIILIFLFAVVADILLLEYILDDGLIKIILQSVSIVILLLILQFFRNPKISVNKNENNMILNINIVPQ